MGDVVALSSFESHRKHDRSDKKSATCAKIMLFTGVRYERMISSDESIKCHFEEVVLDRNVTVKLPR